MSAAPLVDAYDLVVFDLDGVIFLIDRPIPGAVEAVARLGGDGRAFAYATNNASRRSADVADLLTGMGVPATADQVLTSAGAAATLLAERLPAGAPVLVVGAPALHAEVRAVGLVPVTGAEEAPVAVVQGYGPRVGWAELAEASLAVRAGALWVATNTDRTLPSPRGPLPGNGSLVAVLRTALGREPDVVVGKPEPALFTAAAHRYGAARPLVVGDRLDTDIEGAVRAGLDSLLVLTGVSGPADLIAAPPGRRPTYVAADLGGLFAPADALRVPGKEPAGGGWRVTDDGVGWRLDGAGAPLDALRALCAAAWSGGPARRVTGVSAQARAALKELGLD
ncbi:Haloacid Dehalogenase Superfamily Class (subfamily) IIA [Micromonospora pattaloongensis]|uniref:Haloacid Dehalogenase Superfamily Class (Subfamily) IIA n=1 Tax=Micromonospora pattaloongensis TaxID=405436 RepID=A0A1H3T1D2_9ACTN|nr:HAD-IIA family hydrolase [Micromonospora pattaloongensis]SDZ43994.1 Haloacid Dehalogenase Superfamily Class (subfamily) IIA [Micromonospora pattaloongensis]